MKEIKEKPKMAVPKELRKEQKLPRIVSGIGQKTTEYAGFSEESQSDPEYAEQKTEEITNEAAGRILNGTQDSVQRVRDYSKQIREGKQDRRMEAELSGANGNLSEPEYRYWPEQIQKRLQHNRESALEARTEEKTEPLPASAEYGKKERRKKYPDNRSRVSIRQKESEKKTAGQSVKAMEPMLKTAKKTIKTSQTTVRTAEKNAKVSMRSAQRAREAAIQSARASAKAAKMIAKGIAEAVKAIIAEVKQLIAAIAAGGWLGTGLCQGSPGAIPYVSQDFMFSAILEEWGAIFGICLILICMAVFLMFINIAMKLGNRFYRLAALGLGVTYATQVFLTIGGGTKLIPMTGVTLPLVSYGGSSALSTILMFAIVQGLYMLRGDEVKEERRASWQAEARSEYAPRVGARPESASRLSARPAAGNLPFPS